MKDRKPCIHGNLCRGIYALTGRIYSVRCPYGCKFYEPIKIVKKGVLWDEKYRKNGKIVSITESYGKATIRNADSILF